jgi:hypothetical protein
VDVNNKIFIRQIVNKNLNSNTFVVLNSGSNLVAVVDPGEAEPAILLKLFSNKQQINSM